MYQMHYYYISNKVQPFSVVILLCCIMINVCKSFIVSREGDGYSSSDSFTSDQEPITRQR